MRLQPGDRVTFNALLDKVGTIVLGSGVVIWDDWPGADKCMFNRDELTLAPREGVRERVLRYWERDLTRRELNAKRFGTPLERY